MVLQFAADDSGSDAGSSVFVLGGFLARSEAWATFADKWKAVLDGAPYLEYFKAAEANGLRDQFSLGKGWNREKRDDLIISLSHLIKDHVAAQIIVSMDRKEFDNQIGSIPVPVSSPIPATQSPYFILFQELVLATAVYQSCFGSPDPIDFIFDEQGSVGLVAQSWWPRILKETACETKPSLAPYLGAPPIFQDEKEFLPLQAADLIAWNRRRAYDLERKTSLWTPPPRALQILNQVPGVAVELDKARIAKFASTLRAHETAYRKRNPKAVLKSPAEIRAQNKAKKARALKGKSS